MFRIGAMTHNDVIGDMPKALKTRHLRAHAGSAVLAAELRSLSRMIQHAVRRLPLFAVCLFVLFCHDRRPQGPADLSKLDMVLREAIGRGTAERLSVIVSAAPGQFAGLRAQLARSSAAIYAD